LTIEGTEFSNVDIIALAGSGQRAVKLESTVIVEDGAVSISVFQIKNDPKINGIEVRRSLPHLAHAVANGPYTVVDVDNVGSAVVNVDGSESHTHGIDAVLSEWTWKEGSKTLATSEIASFELPVGTHDVSLTVVDTGGSESTESTTVTVQPFGFPDVSALTPQFGSIVGGEVITITGSGFTYLSSETIVHFGIEKLTGKDILLVNSTTITVVSPFVPIGVPVSVSVETPLGRSEEKTFQYVSSIPIAFETSKIVDVTQATCAVFGPDRKLYVGTLKGIVAKFTMDATFTTIIGAVVATVQLGRAILGITFDPMDAGNPNPPVYISSSLLFHGESLSSSGTSINGKISRIVGANLDIVEDIITGLPVCDLDHGMF
jgi:IPT/TIG domain